MKFKSHHGGLELWVKALLPPFSRLLAGSLELHERLEGLISAAIC